MRALLSIAVGLFASNAIAEDLDAGLAAVTNHDWDTAIYHLLPLAEDGNRRAAAELGFIYFAGVQPNDHTNAVRWNRVAAQYGNQSAQYMLGEAFREGWGVRQDLRAAHVWFNISARYGDVQAASQRDQISADLSRYDLSRALSDALICVETDYASCP